MTVMFPGDRGSFYDAPLLWLSSGDELAPGESAEAIMQPLSPDLWTWSWLAPGAKFEIHEGWPAIGTGVILDIHRPSEAPRQTVQPGGQPDRRKRDSPAEPPRPSAR